MKRKESIIFAGYRDWAKKIYDYANFNWYLAETPEELLDLYNIDDCKMVILAGWSWILSREQVSSKLVFGFHPSDLPNYAGGSPIQNQVLDSIVDTKMTLFKLDEKIDHGNFLYKENLSLKGSIESIFRNMTYSSIAIIKSKFIPREEEQ